MEFKIAQTTGKERSIHTLDRDRYIKFCFFQSTSKTFFWICLNEAATRLHDKRQVINFYSCVTRLILLSYGLYSGTKAAV